MDSWDNFHSMQRQATRCVVREQLRGLCAREPYLLLSRVQAFHLQQPYCMRTRISRDRDQSLNRYFNNNSISALPSGVFSGLNSLITLFVWWWWLNLYMCSEATCSCLHIEALVETPFKVYFPTRLQGCRRWRLCRYPSTILDIHLLPSLTIRSKLMCLRELFANRISYVTPGAFSGATSLISMCVPTYLSIYPFTHSYF